MIKKRSNIVICCLILILTCLLLNGCSPENYQIRQGNRQAEEGKYIAAIRWYNLALETNPRTAITYFNRGLAWFYMGEMDKAIDDYTKALEINKELIEAYISRGVTWNKKGDYDFAVSDFAKALQFNPDNTLKAKIYFNRAYTWFKKGDYERAIGDYTEGIRIIEAMKVDPREKAEAYYSRAAAWYEKGDFDNAISDYTKAIEINPKYAEAVFSRANTWHEKRDYASAAIDYERATELDPQNALVYNNYSWLLSTCPDSKFRDGQKALELAQKAVAINPDEVFFLSTLAAAYAELGNFKEAVQTVEKAILLLKKTNKENLMDILIPQLEYYKAGKPWREDVKREDWMLKYEIEKRK